jgi:hypothetical protein
MYPVMSQDNIGSRGIPRAIPILSHQLHPVKAQAAEID